MKLTKSKFIVAVMLIFGVTAFMSCDKTQETIKGTGYSEVSIPDNFGIADSQKSNLFIPEDERIIEEQFYLQLSDKEVIGTQIIELDELGNMISLQISDNVFLETGLDTNFLHLYSEFQSENNLKIGSCLKACNDESIQNPGWCKAGCWALLVVKVAAVVVAACAL
mgnify:CR=1 FL=1|jgi:hypothetical protein